MRLSARCRSTACTCGGFTLLEAVIAAGLLLVTIAAVTWCVVNASRTETRLERSMAGDRALRLVAQRLRLMPFCAGSYPQPATERRAQARDLVAAVFPHAILGQNILSARYVAVAGDETEQGGSFITLLTEDGVPIKCVARFLVAPDGPELGPEALGGWDAATSTAPPAQALSLTLGVAGGGRLVEFTRTALSIAPVQVQATAGAGG